MTVEANDPLPQLFPGDWTVLGEAQSDPEDRSPFLTRVKIRLDGEGDGLGYLVHQTFSDESSVGPIEFKLKDSTLRSADGTQCISFWRQPTLDMIFCLEETGEHTLVVWSAKRQATSQTPYLDSIRGRLIGRNWAIRLTKGAHSPSGQVRLQEFKVDSDPERPNWTGLVSLGVFGLFHIPDIAKKDKLDLYDILTYDERVKSFNSIFGVRSLNFWQGETEAADRIFATFNRKFSLPVIHSEIRDSLAHTMGTSTMGASLPWEDTLDKRHLKDLFDKHKDSPDRFLAQVRNDFNLNFEDPEGDDPDIGIWVGDPP